MYERFTDRARKALQLANGEAQRFNHDYIGTEHILLGLLKEGSGIAANVLRNLNIDTGKIRSDVEKVLVPGPDMFTMGQLPQTPRVKKVIEYTISEARALGHNHVRTAHLLLGLILESQGVAGQVLLANGLTAENVRAEINGLIGTVPKEMAKTATSVPTGVTRWVALKAGTILTTDASDVGMTKVFLPDLSRAVELAVMIKVMAMEPQAGMTSADRLAKVGEMADQLHRLFSESGNTSPSDVKAPPA
jgi:ATP-dependent Clp protease ATP-binding subunit ClpA